MKPRVTNFLFATSATIILAGIAHAASGTWTGASDATWAGANWTASPAPDTGDTATFNGAGAGNTTIDVSGVTIKTILFDTASVAAYTMGTGGAGSQTLVLDNAGALTVGSSVAQNQLFDSAITLGTDKTVQTYTVTNNSTSSLTLAGPITGNNVSGTAGIKTLAVGGTGNSTISGVIANGGATNVALTKSGKGTLTLNGSAVNTNTGITRVTGGTLALDFANLVTPTNLINSASALSLGGGKLSIIGSASGSTAQTFASTASTSGINTISVTNNGTAPTLALGAITPGAGGSLVFNGPATTTYATDGAGVITPTAVAATGTITTTTAGSGGAATPFGLLGTASGNNAYATVGLYDWASTNTTANTAGTSPYTVIGGSQITGFYTTGLANNTTPTTLNHDLTTQQTPTLGGTGNARAGANATVSTLRFNSGHAPYMAVRNGNFLGSGGLLVTPNMGSVNTGLDNVRVGNSSVQIVQNNTSGVFSLGFVFSNANSTAENIVKSGDGTLFVAPVTSQGVRFNYLNASGALTNSTSNYYNFTNTAFSTQGAVHINGGAYVFNNANQFGNPATQTTTAGAGGTINLNGGTLVSGQGDLNLVNPSAGNANRPVFLGGNGGGLGAKSGTTMTAAGVVAGGVGTGPLVIGVPASSANGNTAGLVPGTGGTTANTALNATGTVNLTAPNTYTGGTVLASGVLRINGIFALGGANYGGLTLNGGTLQYATGFTGNGSGDLTSIGTAGVTFASAGGSIDTNGNDVTYAGSIGNGSTGGFTKIGAGTLTLGGANNYSGTTTISAGTLSVTNTTGSGTGSGPVALSGGILSGSGSIAGTVTVGGGTLAPGAAGTTLTIGELAYDSGPLNFTLNGAGPTSSNVVVTNATFTATPTITFNGAASVSDGQSFTLLTSANPITGSSFLSSIAPTVIGRITLAPQLVGNSIVVNATGAAANLVWAGGVSGLTGGVTGDSTTWDNIQTVGTAGNWNNTGARDYFYDGDSVTFNDAGTPNRSVVLTTNNAPGTLTIDNSSDDYTFSGAGSITGSTSLVKTGSAKLTVSTVNSYTGGTTISNGTLALGVADALPASGTLSVQGTGILDLGGFNHSANSITDGGVGTGTITSSAAATLTVNNSIANTFSGTINGGVGLTMSGLGSITLSGSNGFTGGVMINSGSVIVGNAGALNSTTPNAVSFGASSTGKLQLNGYSIAIAGLSTSTPVGTPLVENANATAATLTVNSDADSTYAGLLQDGTGGGALSLVKSGVGNLTLSGANTFSGTTVISGGTLTTGAALALAGSTLNYNNQGGVLSFGSLTAATLGGLSGAQNMALSNATPAGVVLTIGGNGQTTTYSGNLSGLGSLVKTGSGVTTLTGLNTYSGSTAVNAGALELSGSGSVSTTTVSVTGNSTLRLASSTASLTASGICNVNNAGTVFPVLHVVDGSATLSGEINALGQANNGYRIQVDAGTLSTNNIRLGRSSLNFGSEATAIGSTTSGLYVNGGTVNVSGFIDMGVVPNANSSVSTLVANGILNVAGKITVGINSIGVANAPSRWSVFHVSGGEFNSTDATDGIVLGGPLVGSSVFAVSGGDSNVNLIQLGQGTLAGNSVVRLTGGKLYLGAGGIVKASPNVATEIRLAGGTLGAKAAWSTTLPINVAGTGTTYIKAADATDVPFNITLNGPLTGTGSVEKNGLGVVTLGGGHAYSGNTTVYEGKLKVTTNTFNDISGITIYGGATLELAFAGGDKVDSLTINGDTKAPGAWGAPGSGAANTDPALEGTGILYVGVDVPVSGYDAWVATSGLTVGVNDGPNADPDNDGIENQLEFVLGGNPLASSQSILPVLDASGSNFIFTFKREDDSEAEIALTFQHGSDLAGWTDVAIDADGTAPVVTVSENLGEPDDITITIPKGSSTEFFGRLHGVK